LVDGDVNNEEIEYTLLGLGRTTALIMLVSTTTEKSRREKQMYRSGKLAGQVDQSVQ
jgi:hypothetical protein